MIQNDLKRAGAAAALVRDEVLWLAAKLRESEAEKRAMAIRICNLLDAIYNEGPEACAAVCKHYGVSHFHGPNAFLAGEQQEGRG